MQPIFTYLNNYSVTQTHYIFKYLNQYSIPQQILKLNTWVVYLFMSNKSAIHATHFSSFCSTNLSSLVIFEVFIFCLKYSSHFMNYSNYILNSEHNYNIYTLHSSPFYLLILPSIICHLYFTTCNLNNDYLGFSCTKHYWSWLEITHE